MRLSKVLPLLLIAAVTSCDLDPGHSIYSNVVIPVTERIVPDTVIVNQPFNIYARATQDNGCWFNLRFVFRETDDREFALFAVGDFETYGLCPDVLVGADTVITVTPTRTGNHVLTVWMDRLAYEKDTIYVDEVLPGR